MIRVELVGGPYDGKLMAVEGFMPEIRFAKAPQISDTDCSFAEEAPSDIFSINYISYIFSKVKMDTYYYNFDGYNKNKSLV